MSGPLQVLPESPSKLGLKSSAEALPKPSTNRTGITSSWHTISNHFANRAATDSTQENDKNLTKLTQLLDTFVESSDYADLNTLVKHIETLLSKQEYSHLELENLCSNLWNDHSWDSLLKNIREIKFDAVFYMNNTENHLELRKYSTKFADYLQNKISSMNSTQVNLCDFVKLVDAISLTQKLMENLANLFPNPDNPPGTFREFNEQELKESIGKQVSDFQLWVGNFIKAEGVQAYTQNSQGDCNLNEYPNTHETQIRTLREPSATKEFLEKLLVVSAVVLACLSVGIALTVSTPVGIAIGVCAGLALIVAAKLWQDTKNEKQQINAQSDVLQASHPKAVSVEEKPVENKNILTEPWSGPTYAIGISEALGKLSSLWQPAATPTTSTDENNSDSDVIVPMPQV